MCIAKRDAIWPSTYTYPILIAQRAKLLPQGYGSRILAYMYLPVYTAINLHCSQHISASQLYSYPPTRGESAIEHRITRRTYTCTCSIHPHEQTVLYPKPTVSHMTYNAGNRTRPPLDRPKDRLPATTASRGQTRGQAQVCVPMPAALIRTGCYLECSGVCIRVRASVRGRWLGRESWIKHGYM